MIPKQEFAKNFSNRDLCLGFVNPGCFRGSTRIIFLKVNILTYFMTNKYFEKTK
jgi:hypothetical protein